MGLADPSCSPARRHRYGTIVSTCVYIYIYTRYTRFRDPIIRPWRGNSGTEIGLRLKPGAIVGNTRLPRVCDDGGGKARRKSKGQFASSRHLDPSISVCSIIFPGYGAPLWTSGVTLDPEQLSGIIRVGWRKWNNIGMEFSLFYAVRSCRCSTA